MDLNKIIKENKKKIQNIIKLRTNEYNEDLEQEVYIKIWQKFSLYKEGGNFKAWLKVVTENFTKDYLKSKKTKLQKNCISDEIIMNTIEDKKASPDLRLINKERQKKNNFRHKQP